MQGKLLALRLVALFALAVCGASLADYLLGGSPYCGARSGCDEVMSSPFGRLLGVPLPVVGLAAFGLFFGLTLFPRRRDFALLGPLALVAGLAGLGLILVQVLVLGQTCLLCLLIDSAAVTLAVLHLAWRGRPAVLEDLSWPRRLTWLGAALLAAALPRLAAALAPPPATPELVRAHWVEGKVTVVEMLDFDCPQCRRAEAVLATFRRERQTEVHFVRLVAPLPRRHGRWAARAYLAAQTQGKGEAMAAHLFAARDLDPSEGRRAAQALGLQLADYDRMVSDPATDALFEPNVAWLVDAGGGLPLLWVQDQLILGVPTLDTLEAAYRRASSRASAAPRPGQEIQAGNP